MHVARRNVSISSGIGIAVVILALFCNVIASAYNQQWLPPNLTNISVGNTHSCAIANGAAYCWGDNSSGQLGNNSTASSNVPVAVTTSGVLSGKTVTAISAGNNFTCAVASGAAYCWGYSGDGELGNNSTASSNVPVAVTTSGVLSGKTVTAISAGNNFTCAVASGAAYCWGYSAYGELGNNSSGGAQSNVPVAVDVTTKAKGAFISSLAGHTVAGISAGGSSACAYTSDNSTAHCWGVGSMGRLGNGSTTNSSVPVAVNTSGVLSGKSVTSVSVGVYSTCAIASGAAYCWGSDANGQLGNNSTTNSSVPVAVNTSGVLAGTTVTAVSTSESSSTCAIASGAAYCWGSDTNGKLGNNSTTDSSVPVAVTASGVLSGKTVTDISAGFSSTCAVASGAAYCWGGNTNGQLGNNSTTQSLVPVQVVAFSVTSVGDNYRFYNTSTTISPGSPLGTMNQPVTVPAGVDNTLSFTAIGAGSSSSTCAVASGAPYCWGSNASGALGNNSAAPQSNVPVPVTASGVLSGKTVTDISAGNSWACVVASGAAYCWGSNGLGTLGNNSTTDSNVPVAVDTSGALSGKTITAISAGNSATCAVASGAAYCWGNNGLGQLGNNSTTNSNVPVAVDTSGALSGKTITAISTGDSTTCAVASGAAYCWGNNADGELGNNSYTQSNVPVAVVASGVLAGKTIASINIRQYFTCAVASGAAYCWGNNAYGQLGNNSTTSSSVPVAVNTSGVLSGKTIMAINTGISATCAVASGAAYCWGDNTNGKLGNNSTTQSNVPVAVDTSGVLSGKTVTAISAGSSYTCAVASGAPYCWGYNYYGQLGNNSTTQSLVPVTVSVPTDPSGLPNSVRLHIGVKANTAISASQVNYSLGYAKKTATTCSVQTTGFSPVTTSTPIAWYDPGSPANGATISASANDPTFSGTTIYENYVSGGTSFTNPAALSVGQYGLWSFSLKNVSTDPTASYCLHIAYADGTPLDSYTQYPEIGTTSTLPDVGFVDSGGSPITNPVFTMPSTNMLSTCQSSTGAMGSSSGQKMRITQSGGAGSGWNVSIAPTSGDTALWYDSVKGNYYDFNDGAGSPPGCYAGSDGDTYAGQLSVNGSTSVLAPQSGCSTTGLSLATSNTPYANGTTSAITLITSSSASQSGCYWDMYGTQFAQMIPPSQPAGNYVLNLTATVTAS